MTRSGELADLLETARDVFRAELGKGIPSDKHYAAAMVANAMAIAARFLRAGVQDGRANYVALYGRDALSALEADLERRLVADIRAGRFDTCQADRLRALLLSRTVERLTISDPEALAASRLG
jgi:Domain of unknown function (DUF6285)